VKLIFSSRVPAECKADLEELLFLNPRQYRVRDGILNSLQQFGHPRIEPVADGLQIRVGDHEAQTLFAFDRERAEPGPVGAVIFLRTSREEIAIIHVAVHDDYALRGTEAGVGLGVTLVEKVKEIATRIVGVERIVFFYRRHVVMRL
jgi:hypothetical protein